MNASAKVTAACVMKNSENTRYPSSPKIPERVICARYTPVMPARPEHGHDQAHEVHDEPRAGGDRGDVFVRVQGLDQDEDHPGDHEGDRRRAGESGCGDGHANCSFVTGLWCRGGLPLHPGDAAPNSPADDQLGDAEVDQPGRGHRDGARPSSWLEPKSDRDRDQEDGLRAGGDAERVCARHPGAVHHEPAADDRPHREHEADDHVGPENPADHAQRGAVSGGQRGERRHPEAGERDDEARRDEDASGHLVPAAPSRAAARAGTGRRRRR